MGQIIHFRSHTSSRRGGIGSLQKIRSRGIEYASLRPATPTDDARDIAWKQSARSDTLSVKSREDDTRLDIMLIGSPDISWRFSLDTGDDKHSFYARIADASRQTSHTSGYTYIEYMYTHESISEICTLLRKKKVQNTVILLVVSDLDSSIYSDLSLLGKQNDVIVIHLLHPYERNPEKYPHILTESKRINQKEYLDELAQVQDNIKILLNKNSISFLPADSDESPVEILNHFFKHRYAHK